MIIWPQERDIIDFQANTVTDVVSLVVWNAGVANALYRSMEHL